MSPRTLDWIDRTADAYMIRYGGPIVGPVPSFHPFQPFFLGNDMDENNENIL